MEYRYLGNTGMKVSALCLGTITFGREITNEATAVEILDTFAAAGGNFIDTASLYGNGESEAMIGSWMKNQTRDALVIATKVFGPVGANPNDIGLSRKHILSSVESSLRRLETDYVDLLQIHTWDTRTPIEEVLFTLHSLVQSGKVRYIGASNLSGWQLQKAVDVSRSNGWAAFVSLQPLYNLLNRDIEWELLPVCQNENISIIPYSPLMGGWLSGKYRRGMTQPIQNTRIAEDMMLAGWNEYANERTWTLLDEVFAIGGELGKTPAQVALKWLLQRVTSPIIGVRTLHQLNDNLGAVGWQLSTEQAARLDAASAERPRYPYNVLQMMSGLRA
jgi:aryl-alcohol dehydrogenase-like predicted oxidoreductase